jgi:hypothetical protein
VLAMVAAWRWDIRDEFPDGHQHGRHILSLLRQGPPWPALDSDWPRTSVASHIDERGWGAGPGFLGR